MDGFPFALYHTNGCGGPCFLLSERPAEDDMMDPEKAVHLDGRKMFMGERVVCDSCGEPLVRPLDNCIEYVEVS